MREFRDKKHVPRFLKRQMNRVGFHQGYPDEQREIGLQVQVSSRFCTDQLHDLWNVSQTENQSAGELQNIE